MKRICHLLTILALIAAAAPVLSAPDTYRWEFDTPTNYVYDAQLVEVADGLVRLRSQIDVVVDADFEEYTNGAYSSVAFDESASIRLASDNGLFASNGTFVSRILDGGSLNTWQALHLSASSEAYISDPGILTYFAMDSDGWLDQATQSSAQPDGSPLFTTDAAVGSHAGRFNNGSVVLPANPVFGLRAFTLAFWVKLDAPGKYDAVFGGEQSGSHFMIRQPTDTGKSLSVMITTTEGYIGFGIPMDLGVYYHVSVTWGGDSSDAEARKPRLYVNGILVSEGVATTGSVNYNGQVHLGSENVNAAQRYWQGIIDEFIIVDRAMNAAEVRRLFEGQSKLFVPLAVTVRSGSDVATLLSRGFVGDEGTSNTIYGAGFSQLHFAPEFHIDDPLVQYRVDLNANKDLTKTPFVSSVSFIGSQKSVRDNTFSDYQAGEVLENIVLSPEALNTPFLGLAKHPNGGYYTNGWYESRLFDGGEPSLWRQLSWATAPELPSTTPGLIALWHMNLNWRDARQGYSILSALNAAYTRYAKAGIASGQFNGLNNTISGFPAIASVKTIEFWLNTDEPNTPIMSLTGDKFLRVANGSLAASGIAVKDAALYVNGSIASPRLLPGWNHVAVVFAAADGLTLDGLEVGRVQDVGFFTGKLDELAVYNRALVAGEIESHYVLGCREVAGRVAFQVFDEVSQSFVGPGNLPNTFLTEPPSTTTEANLNVANQRYIRYRVLLESDGVSTPMIRNPKLTTAAPGVLSFSDTTAADFYQGERIDGRSQIYGGLVSVDNLVSSGPKNVEPSSPLVVGIWHFDDDSWAGGQTVEGGLGGGGLAYGDAAPSFDARVGLKSGVFDGDGDYVDDLSATLPLSDSDFSLGLWFKTSSSAGAPLVSVNDALQYAALRMYSDGSITGGVSFVVNDGSGEQMAISERGLLNDGRWHHVVGVRNGYQLLVYVDGEREGGALAPSLGICGVDSDFIVAADPTRTVFFAGQLDELVVHRRAITESEIGQIFAGRVRSGVEGYLTSATLERPEPSIWEALSWVPMGPFSKPLIAEDTETGLVGLWHLNESGGSVSNAVQGIGLAGTVVGATYGAPGRFDTALQFDATGQQYVQIAHSATLEPNPERLTVEAWVNMAEVDNRPVLAKRTPTQGYALYTDADGLPVFWLGGVACAGRVPLRANKWTHLAGVLDGNQLALSVDGHRVAVADSTGSLASGADLYLGRSYDAGSYYDGVIDEVAVHARTLNAEQLLDHYRSGVVTVKLQARSSMTNTFAMPFMGPGRSTNTFFTTFSSEDITLDIDIGMYFQYKVFFETEDHRFAPDFRGISVLVSGYPISRPTVSPVPSAGYEFVGHLIDFDHRRVQNDNTGAKYQISGDLGSAPTWYYWHDGNAQWVPEDPFGPTPVYDYQANSASHINDNIDEFYTQVYNSTGGLFRFRAFLASGGANRAALDWVEIHAADGRINITAPDGDEDGLLAWLVQVPYEITWDYTSNLTGTVHIEFWNGNDASPSWQDLDPPATAVPITAGTYTWETPVTITDQALIRLTYNEDPTIYDESDDVFELKRGLQIFDHNGGDPTWYIGETNLIRWRRSQLATAAHIDFLSDLNATNFVRLTSSPIGVKPINEFEWATPMTNANLVSESGYLRVTGAKYSDVSDESFVLAGAVLTKPSPGQGVKKDAPFDLTWVSAGMGTNVKIELQATLGGSWEVLDDAAPNVSGINTFTWTPTNEPSESARIRFTSLADTRARGLSLPFTIAAIELKRPVSDPNLSQSEVWLQGTTQEVYWISGGAGDFVNILYSVDGGDNYSLVVSNYQNEAGVTNVYPWKIPPRPSPAVRLRIEDSAQPNELFSETPYDFQIAGLRILQPNGPFPPEAWDKGTPYFVRWEHNAVGAKGELDFSYDGGATWQNIITDDGLIGFTFQSYTPTNPTLNARVRIVATDPAPFTDVFDMSDNDFAVAGIRLFEPVSGDSYTIGTTNPVSYRIAATLNSGNHAPIYYSGDGGATYDRARPINTIDDVFSDGGDHTFEWTVESFRRPSSSAKLRVESAGYFVESDEFTLRGISFDAPGPGAIWAPGLQSVQWAVAGLAADARCDITLSTEGGAPGTFTYLIAADRFATVGSVPWNLPFGLGPSTNARMRIEITDSIEGPGDIGFFADSDIFSLQGIGVVTPNAATKWDLGSTQTIGWDAASGGPLVDIFYSSDGGAHYDAAQVAGFVSSADGFNTNLWTIEMSRMPSTNARIKVASRLYPGIEDVSDNFMMRGIQVLRPNSSDIYATTDFTNLIEWVGINDVGPGLYDLSYILNGGPPIPITNGVSGPQFNWKIPGSAVSPHVQVVVTDGTHSNTSEVFRVVDRPTVQFANPKAGAFWQVGQTYDIEWIRGGDIANDFTLWYSQYPFGTSNRMTQGSGIVYDETNNTFELSWQVPDLLGQTKFIVYHNDPQKQIADTSGVFNIVGRFRILDPVADEEVFALKPRTPIAWETLGSVPYVDLYYSASLAHEPDSWIKINDSPIENSFKAFDPNDTDPWVRKSYPWTVENDRTSIAKVRVQEHAYSEKFDPAITGPFADSDEFSVLYYRVYWDVFDSVTRTNLDHLSVVDTSGWSAADLSSKPPETIFNDYPWGSFNTEFYREGFFDASVLFWDSENTDISIPGPKVWTQEVGMARSSVEPDFHVLATFSYEPTNSMFTIHSWLQRSGVILDKATRSTITVFDLDGDTIDVLENTTPHSNGVFWTIWDASSLDARSVYFAKVDIEFSGFTYSSGLTFTLRVSVSEEIEDALLQAAQALQTNILSGVSDVLTNVSSLAEDFEKLQLSQESNFSNLTEVARLTTNMLGEVKSDVKFATNELVDVIGPQLDFVTNRVTTIGDDVRDTLARILTRPDAVALGSTNQIIYKTRAGYDPGMVQLQVFLASGGAALDTITLSEAVNGLYEATYTANWSPGVNSYKLVCSDPHAQDRIVLRVTARDLYQVPDILSSVSNRLGEIEFDLVDLTVVTHSITNDLTPLIRSVRADVGYLSTDLSNLVGKLSVDFTYIQDNVSQLTNQLATFAGLDKIGQQVGLLTNAMDKILIITNTAELVENLTNALGGVDAALFKKIGDDVGTLTNDLSVVDWTDILALRSGVGSISNSLLASGGLSAQIASLTNALIGVDFDLLADNVNAVTNTLTALNVLLTNSLLDVDFALLARNVGDVTNTLSALNALLTNSVRDVDFRAMAAGVSSITGDVSVLRKVASDVTSLTGTVSVVSLMSDQVDDLWQELTRVDWDLLDSIALDASTATNILGGLGGLQDLADKIGGISNAVAELATLTNLTSQVDSLAQRLLPIDFDLMARSVAETTNTLAKLSDLGVIADQISGLTNSLESLNALTNMVGTVELLGSSLLGVDYVKLAGDVSGMTNTLSSFAKLADVADQLSGLSNAVSELAGVTGIVATVDALGAALLTVDFDEMADNLGYTTNRLSGLGSLYDLVPGLSKLTNSLGSVSSITNVTEQINALSATLQGVDFLGMARGVSNITDNVSDIDWTQITSMQGDVTNILGVVGAVSDLQQIANDLVSLTNAMANLSNVTNIGAEVSALTNALKDVNWVDVLEIRDNMRGVTNSLQGFSVTEFQKIAGALSEVTNAVASLGDITNMPAQVDALVGTLVGVDFFSLTNDVTTMAVALNDFDWSTILKVGSDVRDATNALAGLTALGDLIPKITNLTNAFADLQAVTNLASQVDKMALAMGDISLADMAFDLGVLTNDVKQLDLAVLQSIQSDISGMTNLLELVNLNQLNSIQGGVTAISNLLDDINIEFVLGDIADDVRGITNRIDALGDINEFARRLESLTNAVAQLAGVTNLGTDVSALTNALSGVDWQDVRYLRSRVDEITNSLNGVSWSDIDTLLADMTGVTNKLDNLSGLPEVAATLRGLTNSLAQIGDLSGVALGVGRLTNQLAAVDWQDVLDIQTEIGLMTNRLDALDVLPDVLASLSNVVGGAASLTNFEEQVSAITNLFQDVDWADIQQLMTEMDVVTNKISSLTGLDDVARTLRSLTNSIVQLSGVTNLGSDISGLTNALSGVNWDDVRYLRGRVDDITNRLESLSGIPGLLVGISNVVDGAAGITNIQSQVSFITNVLTGVDWGNVLDLMAEMDDVTNKLNTISGLDGVAATLRELTNSISQLAGVTNLGTEIGNLTNQLQGIDWRDVLDIQVQVHDITNRLSGLTDIAQVATVLQSLTNSLSGIDGFTNLTDQVRAITNRLGRLDWGDVLKVRGDVESLTNDVRNLAGVSDSLAKVSRSIAGLDSLSAASDDIVSMGAAFSAADWDDVRTVRETVSRLDGALKGMTASDLNAISDIEELLGNAGDSALADTFFGKMAALERTLTQVGTDARNASSRAGGAKSSASGAVGGIEELKSELAQGDLPGALAAVREVQRLLAKTQAELEQIPKDVDPESAFASVRKMASEIEELASSGGWDFLLKLKAPEGEEADVGQGVGDEALLRALHENIQEVRSGMEFMQKLMDEMRYEPVVQETLMAVE